MSRPAAQFLFLLQEGPHQVAPADPLRKSRLDVVLIMIVSLLLGSTAHRLHVARRRKPSSTNRKSRFRQRQGVVRPSRNRRTNAHCHAVPPQPETRPRRRHELHRKCRADDPAASRCCSALPQPSGSWLPLQVRRADSLAVAFATTPYPARAVWLAVPANWEGVVSSRVGPETRRVPAPR